MIKPCDDSERMPDRLGSPRRAMVVRSLGLVVLAVALSLTAVVPEAAAAQAKRKPGPAGRSLVGRGIVQAVTSKAVVLRRLDGTTLTVPVNAKTKVRVNGRRATLARVEPGFAAVVVWRTGKPAQELRTFSLPSGHDRPAHPPKAGPPRTPSP